MVPLKERIFITGAKAVLPGVFQDGQGGVAREYLHVDEPTPVKGAKYLNRSTILGLAAAATVLRSQDSFTDEPHKSGVCLATALGNCNKVAQMANQIRSGGIRELSPMDLPTASINVIAAKIAIEHGLKGINATLTGAAAPSLDVLVFGCRSVATGRAHRMLVVGVEEGINCCNPHGVTELREGSAALLLEDEAASARRTASIYGEIAGWKGAFVNTTDDLAALVAASKASGPIDAVFDCRVDVSKNGERGFLASLYGPDSSVTLASELLGGRPGVDGLIGICEALHRIGEGKASRCAVFSGREQGQQTVVVVKGVDR